MDVTRSRKLVVNALLVGISGPLVLRVVTAFEQKRITTLRADDIPAACARIAVDMPHIVLVMCPASESEREQLMDRALAVGALVVHVDPQLDDDTFKHFIDSSVRAALERKLRREEADRDLAQTHNSDIPVDFDEGWSEADKSSG